MSWLDAACGWGLGALADSIGWGAPGATRPKKKPLRPNRRHPCVCVRRALPDGTLFEGNCGETVGRKGRVKKGHDGGDGYDHGAELARDRARYQERRRLEMIRVNDELALLASMMFDGHEGGGDALTLAQIATGIETKHADVLSGRQYSLYCGLSKQNGAYPKTVRGEGGRFLWESKDVMANSTNIPIVQWRSHLFATRTTLSRGEL